MVLYILKIRFYKISNFFNLKIEDDTQVIGLIFDSPTIEQAEAKKPNIISKIFGSSKNGNNIKYVVIVSIIKSFSGSAGISLGIDTFQKEKRIFE